MSTIKIAEIDIRVQKIEEEQKEFKCILHNNDFNKYQRMQVKEILENNLANFGVSLDKKFSDFLKILNEKFVSKKEHQDEKEALQEQINKRNSFVTKYLFFLTFGLIMSIFISRLENLDFLNLMVDVIVSRISN